MNPITRIHAVETPDSRNRPTLAVTVETAAGAATFHVPSGASTGSREALELRDADGHVASAIRNIKEVIEPALLNKDVADQKAIDDTMRKLDGTPFKSVLGGNSMIGVSIACAKAAAVARGIQPFEHLRSLATIRPSREVPLLYLNYINGGKHATSPLSFQEHILVPETDSVQDAMNAARTIDQKLAERVRERYGEDASSSLGDEGGYVIPESSPRVPFELLQGAIEDSNLDFTVRLATDVAASSFYSDNVYTVGGVQYTKDTLMSLYQELISDFSLISVEDPFEEGAFEDFARLQALTDARLVGDDLTVTSTTSLARAISEKSIRAIIIKPNQIGTLTETLETMRLARENDIDCIVSHRSGETSDTFVADLAFAFGAFGLKAGALRKPERAVKYERLLEITTS